MPKTESRRKTARSARRSKRPAGRNNRARAVPAAAPEMEEFEEGRYPDKAAGLHSEEDAGLDAERPPAGPRGRAAIRQKELSRRGGGREGARR
ncbi:MAG: hypothetical protein HY553_10580 [Elusimicrobia bacterium]|nr:hypothetical protein [Elusimicrobiota bacterium]